MFIALGALIASAQTSLSGKVVEVVDGKTLVLETSAGRISTQLQYVEVPDDDQPLFGLTKDHLSKLTVGKSVELKPQRIVRGKTIGRMTLDGVDLSLQMIRDGAAWHEPKDTSGQPKDEAADYEANQTLAKGEKRGVWSVPALKTPWEVRAEKNQSQRALETARRIAHPTLVGVGEFHSDTRRPLGRNSATGGISARNEMNTWVSVFSRAGKETFGIQTFSDPQGRYSAVYTSAALIDFASGAGKERLECRAMLVSVNLINGGRTKIYLIGFRAISEDYRFSRARSRLTLLVDKQAIALGSPRGFRGKGTIGVEEVMFYKVSWATLKKIGNAKKVEMRIDKLTAPLSDESRELFRQLVKATG